MVVVVVVVFLAVNPKIKVGQWYKFYSHCVKTPLPLSFLPPVLCANRDKGGCYVSYFLPLRWVFFMFAFFLQSMNRTDRSPVGLHPASAENTSFPTTSTALVANVCWSIRTHTHVHRKAKDLCLEVVTLAALSMQELSLHWHLCTVTAIHVWWVLHT